ncbi:MAG: phytanoyl-CoA dioxygenase [Gemmatimonadetes bacterium]|nr:phytanoyl-CoA dioxygenase [Gemmatimonadota bacterium]|tara:strand:- start:11039 stop:11842 length:804 start_codon:yes stop_codon:yes gene_type:complete
MKSELEEEQIAFYRENGFVAIEGFLDDDELAEWRRVTEEAVERRLASNTLNNQKKYNDYYARVFTQCLRLADAHDRMRELIYDRRIGRMGAELAGVEGLRVWHDQALFKPPFGNPTAWHLDNPYWSFSSRDSLSIWIALDDATLENGCMWYIPGSHKMATYENVGIDQNLGGLFEVYPAWKEIDPVAVPARAGDAVWHNGLTAHGAGANMTRHPRRAMTCACMSDGATFNGKQNILPEEYFETLTEGDLLDDETQNPLIWHQSWEKA